MLSEEEISIIEKSVKTKLINVKSPVVKGMLLALPIVVGYLPLAFAYGVMAQDAHLSFFATVLMSIIVFAGASQYMAVGMIVALQPVASIVIATFVINLRHLLMATAMAPKLKNWSLTQRLLFAVELTDESFAVHTTHYARHEPDAIRDIATNATAQMSWIVGTILGFAASSKLGDIRVLGLDFALAAMFIALLVMQIKTRLMLLVAILTAVLAIEMHVTGYKTGSILVAAIFGATVGMIGELWQTRQSS